MDELKIPEKFILSVKEAALYFGMGEKKIRRLAEDNEGDFALYNGNRYLVIRPLMEQYFTALAKKGGTQDAESNTGE